MKGDSTSTRRDARCQTSLVCSTEHGMVIIEDNNAMRSGRTLLFRDLLSGIVPAYSWEKLPYVAAGRF